MWMSTAPCRSSRSRRGGSSGILNLAWQDSRRPPGSVENGSGLDFDQHIRVHQARHANRRNAGRTAGLGMLLDKLGAGGKRLPPPFLAIDKIEQQVDDIIPGRSGRLD